MKICPVCQTTFNDALRFCTKDGSPLTSFHPNPPVQTAPEPLDEVSTQSPTPNSIYDKTYNLLGVESPPRLSAPSAPLADEQPAPQPRADEQSAPRPPVVTSATAANQSGRKSNTLLLAILGILIGLGVLGAAGAGVWWFSSVGNQVEVANTNINAVPSPNLTNQNSSNSELLSSNLDANSTQNANSASNLNLNVNLQTNTNVNLRPTPRPSPSPSATPSERNSNNRSNNNRTTLGINAAPAAVATPQTRPNIQPTPKPIQQKTIVTSGGVVNGKATSLPKPVYPAIARTARASGQVQVVVLINENGNVESARAVSGPGLLRGAAESAARQARFSPTILSGQPVKVSGVIIYNFVL